jgi:hypothetical protein
MWIATRRPKMSRYLIATLRVLAETGTLLGGPVFKDPQLARAVDRRQVGGRKHGLR